MKAIRLHARGGPEQIVFEDAPTPEPGPGQVRVKVHAAAITPTELTWDETYKHPDGSPRLPTIPGHDVSGVVDAIGPDAEGFAVGDAVFGLIDFPFNGSLAEYVVAPADDFAFKPRTLGHSHAAAVPLSALTAWQALFDHGQMKPKQRVLVHGGAGGVGAYAVRIAKHHGAVVVATASGRHAAVLKAHGVDVVIDYTTTAFEDEAGEVDIVLDTVGGDVRARSWDVLKPGGTLVAITAPIAKQPRKDVKGVFFIVRPDRGQLMSIGRLVDTNKLRPIVAATYDLADTKAAFERAVVGHLGGKIVVKVV